MSVYIRQEVAINTGDSKNRISDALYGLRMSFLKEMTETGKANLNTKLSFFQEYQEAKMC
jgi:hypothetical protein